MFSRCIVINLERRPDRWDAFQSRLPADWPLPPPQRFAAIDGSRVPAPVWWKVWPGAWGAYRSHMAVIEQALSDGTSSLLVMEDDATFCPDFAQQTIDFMAAVPTDWQMIYFGGQHIQAWRGIAQPISDLVVLPFNVNRLHAYALNRSGMNVLYRHLNDTRDWKSNHHVDHHIGKLHMERRIRVYAPRHWLVGQAGGVSDINGRDLPERTWNADIPGGQVAAAFRE